MCFKPQNKVRKNAVFVRSNIKILRKIFIKNDL